MDRDDLASYLALNQCQGIGAISFRKIIDHFKSDLSSLFKLSAHDLSAIGLNQIQINSLQNLAWDSVEQSLDWAESSPDYSILVVDQPGYPELLKQVRDAPPVLFTNGNTDLLNSPQIAIVGSRNCTPGGADTAAKFASYLSRAGLTITSGMAVGIDFHAHSAVLKSNGNTIAILGTGIDRIYPSRNKQLAYQIAEKGLLVSEFPLGTAPNPNNFPKRNRIISGLSVATLVIEATRNSGSLITARLSMEQGREVFAIPGSIHNPQAKGCHHLIREGAKLVDQASDIIDDIGSLLGFVAQQVNTTEDSNPDDLDQDYQRLLEIMGYDPVSLDILVERSGLTIEQLSSMLLILELNDQIQSASGGLYVRC
jgi:DNA processing protein